MPYKNREDYLKWRAANRAKLQSYVREYETANPEKAKEWDSNYRESLKIKKRCPECKKHLHIRKDYTSFYPVIHCKYCGAKIKIGKTLGDNPNTDNAHGIRLKVVA